MIDIKNRLDKKTQREICYINGMRTEDTSASKVPSESWELYTGDGNVRELLLRTPIRQLKAQFPALNVVFTDCCHQLVNHLYVQFHKRRPHSIEFVSEHDEKTWQQPFTITTFLDAIERVGDSFKAAGASVTTSFDDLEVARMSFAISEPASRLSQEVEQHVPIVREILDAALDGLWRAGFMSHMFLKYMRNIKLRWSVF